MAFVLAAPVLPARPSALTGRRLSTAAPPAGSVQTPSARPPRMSVEFQTYSGGLDRISIAPYRITRDLFKPPPATLTDEDKDAAVAAGLRQLFGNAYLMEEERAELYTMESNYRAGRITAKEFARRVAKSATYRQRFFDTVSQYRFIELNFKHFLGRAPLDQVEYSKHFKIFAAGGYDAEIDSYFDDDEYDDVFGEDYMPYTRFRGTYAPINQFNRMCAIEGGWAGSDKKKPQTLVTSLAANTPTKPFSVADGLPAIPNAEHPSKKYDLPPASLERFRNELELASAKACQLELELKEAYEKLEGFRSYVNPFKSMVADMDITPLYGRNYGNGAVTVFSGQYQGAPMGTWGSSGVANISGPTRRPARDIAKKEKQLERVKQLIVDLDRRVSVLEAEREKPAITPTALDFDMDGVSQSVDGPIQTSFIPSGAEDQVITVDPRDAVNLLDAVLVDEDDEESGLVKPKKVTVVTARQIADVGKLPKEAIEDLEEANKASGKSFLEGKGRTSFPGDGSEMTVGG